MYDYDLETGEIRYGIAGRILISLNDTMRKLIFPVLSVGPIPNHVSFIMDGNRRFATKMKLLEKSGGQKAGFVAMMFMLQCCYELGVKYMSVYAFSIANFKRLPDEVEDVMDLILKVVEEFLKKESIVNKYGIKIMVIGDLTLLTEPVRVAVEKAMKSTENNTNTVLLVCLAYASDHEIPRAVDVSCKEKLGNIGTSESAVSEEIRDIKVVDLEKHMLMAVAPDPDIMFRTSGETRLSCFLLWQTTNCLLYAPKVLWPEIDLRHFVLGVLKFQASYNYLEKKKKQS